MIRYAITGGDKLRRRKDLIGDARRWAVAGVAYVQLREKWMQAGELVATATEMMQMFAGIGGQTKLLVNGRVDVAVAAGADGVHLTSGGGELTAGQVREVYARAGMGVPVVSGSCHTAEDVRRFVGDGADLLLFGPVFGKDVAGSQVVPGIGLERLRMASEVAGRIPVLALGGVTDENSGSCVDAGAAGVAGMRLFA